MRVNLGLFQPDVNVIWDLAPHDFAVMDYLIPERPAAVSASGKAHVNGFEDTAYITVYFNSNMIAHFNVNWLSPVKVRTTLIGGEKKMLVWSDLEADEKIKIYDKGVDVSNRESDYNLRVSYRSGDMHAPRVRAGGGAQAGNGALHLLHREQRARRSTTAKAGSGSSSCWRRATPRSNRTEGRSPYDTTTPLRTTCGWARTSSSPDFINLYGCTIGDNTKIGTFVEVQKNAFIGSNCKIQSHTFICEGVHHRGRRLHRARRHVRQRQVPPGHGRRTAGSRARRTGRWMPTVVKKGASIGSGVTILCNVTIGEEPSSARAAS